MPIFPTGYTQKTTPADDDQVLIGDSAASNAIKKTKISSIVAKAVAAVQALTNWITTGMLQALSVTSPKIDFSTFMKHFVDTRGQINYSNPANFATYVDMTGATYTFTPSRNYMYIAMIEGRAGNGSGNKGMRILANGVVVSPEISQNLNATGMTMVGFHSGLISSGVPLTLKAQFASSSANDIVYSAQFTVIAIPI